MEQEHKNWKPVLIAALAALAVVAVLLVLFFSARGAGSAQPIVLPEQTVSEKTDTPQESKPGDTLAEISRENVQNVLKKSVSRPESYHQTMRIVITSGSISREQTAERWVQGELVKAQLTDAFETKCAIADATELYLWYDEEEPVKLARGAGMSADTLAGVPGYERILEFSKSQITQTAFVSLSEQQTDCIYVSVQDGALQQEYWVSLESGLLCRQMMLEDGELVYLMEQISLEVFPEHDVAMEGVFSLPDGTEPFAQQDEPPADATEA